MFSSSSNDRRSLPFTFVLAAVRRLTCDSDEQVPIERERTDVYRLLLVLQGTPEVKFEGQGRMAEPGTCLLISPGSEAVITGNGRACAACLMSFTAIHVGADDKALQSILERLSQGTRLPASVLNEFAGLWEKGDARQDGLIQLRWNRDFLSLLLLLLEQSALEKQSRDPESSVGQTIDFLQNHYHRVITVQQLADMAQLPRWQYLRIFKKLTGTKPSSYLIHLRIEQAKIRLSGTDEQVWEVAHRVGFSDEHYFNRRFKLLTGVSPGQYARIYNPKHSAPREQEAVHPSPAALSRIVYDDGGTLGDLLALDISPVGANLRFCDNDPLLGKVQLTREIGFPLSPDKVRELNPDLVLLSRYGSDKYPELSAIAPTIVVNEYAPMYRRMQKLGDVLGIRERADRWLNAYDLRRERMWQKLQARKADDETATVLFYDGNLKLYLLHRQRGLAKLLYHPLGFRMDERIQRLRPVRGHYYISITPERLDQYAVGDRLFVFVRPDLRVSAVLSELACCSSWVRLPAVRSGKVHCLEAFWNLDDALTSQLALEHFPALWT